MPGSITGRCCANFRIHFQTVHNRVQTGNRALCRLARIFRFSCRSVDIAARHGGDEFAVVLPMSGSEAANIVGRRICERLSNDREEPRLSVSVGIAIYPENGKTLDILFQVADRALYKMKERAKKAAIYPGILPKL